MWSVALVVFLISATNFGGPAGLTRAEPWQYAAKMGLGALIGFTLLAPLILRDAEKKPHRWLESAVGQAIGRWSYGIFIWHLAVLSIVFPVFGIVPFSGDFLLVLTLTIAITLPIAAASYALIEEPVRRYVRRREQLAAARKAEQTGDA
jgi:peptidoglycan/LPS O-acetylase OafA/YrhL